MSGANLSEHLRRFKKKIDEILNLKHDSTDKIVDYYNINSLILMF